MKRNLSNPDLLTNIYNKFFEVRNGGNSQRVEKEDFFAAWKTQLHTTKVKALICLRKESPFAPPVIFLEDKDKFLEWPHVERSGKLCLIQEDARIFHTYDELFQINLLKDLIERAEKLIEEGITGITKNDFIEEIRSYWLTADLSIGSLCDLDSYETKIISHFSGFKNLNPTGIFFDNDKKGNEWLENMGLFSPRMKQAIVFKLDVAPFPKDYPVSGANILSFIQKHSSLSNEEIYDIFKKCVSKQDIKTLPILFCVDTGDTGIATLEVSLTRRNSEKNRSGLPKETPYKHLQKDDDKADRYLDKKATLERRIATRINSEWIYKRGGTNEANLLKNKKVCILGCGSLGSGIAELILKSGVSNLALVDSDILNWENIARHTLGAEQTKQHKVTALKKKFVQHFPFCKIKAYAKKWQDLSEIEFAEISKYDLIISATAEWSSDDHLNKLFKLHFRSFPPVLFTWLEPFALAGQALLVNYRGACFQCSIDDNLKFKNRVIEVDKEIKTNDTACGGASSPYGAIEMSFVQGMAAELAIEFLVGKINSSANRTWIGSVDKIKNHGFNINNIWKEIIESQGNGGRRTFCKKIPVSSNCKLCKP